jgi:hypothetical protein
VEDLCLLHIIGDRVHVSNTNRLNRGLGELFHLIKQGGGWCQTSGLALLGLLKVIEQRVV